ncbi:MAG: protein phosphatase 2C domain-containing protein [Bacteroidales bacterium]|nr:protein phosphatase 2C domain-containing protein [Bacteroidales bacterium]
MSFTPNIPNASVNKEYSYLITFPPIYHGIVISGIDKDEIGLEIESITENSFKIFGTPIKSGTIEIKVKYIQEGLFSNKSKEEIFELIINPDPRDLWKDLPVPDDIEYKKENEFTKCVIPQKEGLKNVIAASKRGRSHAQEAKSRDDHFKITFNPDNEWYILAVADGAGSAEFSREGARIACETVWEFCNQKLSENQDFDNAIIAYKQAADSKDEAKELEARKVIGNQLYSLLVMAAYKAHVAINKEATQKERQAKAYSTTLLLSVVKKFDFGWFTSAFWIGDGAICLFDMNNKTAKLLGIPDEGEYSGQTRFVTMSEVFTDSTALFKRLRFNIVDDFTALFLMSDGVSDPMFETDFNLNNYDKWVEFYKNITENQENPVDLSHEKSEEAKQALLNWLNFWSPGNHDDRTIAILY